MDAQIIDKIRKLMAHSESAKEMGSIAEAEAFAQKAQKLLQEYNLTKADLTEEEAKAEILHDEMPAKVPGVGGKSSFNVMAVIARYNWCQAYTMGRSSLNKMIMVGSPENIEVCKYIHSTVINAFMSIGRKEYKEYKENFTPDQNFKTGKPVGFDTYMRTFFLGAARGLSEKLRAEREEFEKENESSTAIIRTNEVVINDYVTSTWGGTGKARATSYSHAGDAYASGRSAGKNVNIAKGVSTTSKPITRKRLN
jgi:hypothetical protein